MRHAAPIIALFVGAALSAWAQDARPEDLPAAIRAELGADPTAPIVMTPVHSKDAGDQIIIGAEREMAHELVAVHFASLAQGRSLWRLQFTEPWEERGDVALIVYIDADNDPQTGRQGGGVQGTDLMLRPDRLENHGLPATVLRAIAAHGDSLYITLDGPLNIEDGEIAIRAYVLVQNRPNPADQSRTPWFEVRVPATAAAPVVVSERHPLYRPPEVIEHVNVRVPVDGGGRRAIVTWMTSWRTDSVVQWGEEGRLESLASGADVARNHRVVIDGLEPGRTYHARVRARGGNGELISSDAFAFSTTVAEPRGSVAREQVPLRVVGAPGEARPVTQGVPFPQGALGSADHVRVLSAAGGEVPAQADVTSRWPDESVRWIMLDFQADIPDGGETQYVLEFGSEITRAPAPASIAVSEAEDAIVVDTGVLRVRLDRARFAFLGEAWLDADGDGVYSDDERVTEAEGAGVVLTDLDGTQFTSLGAPEMLVVTRAGPLHAVVTAQGAHRSADGEALFRYEQRLHFYAGSPTVRVFHSFENDRSDEVFTTIRALDLRIPLAGGASGGAFVGGEGGVIESAEGRLLQYDDTGYLVEGAVEAEGWRAPGAMQAAGPRGSIVVAVRDFWQLWPKSLSVDDRAAVFGIMPELPPGIYDEIDRELEDRVYYAVHEGVYTLHRAHSMTHEFTVRFAAGEVDAREDATRMAETPVAIAPPQWYADSKAFWHITPRTEGEFDRYEQFVDEVLAAFLRLREQNREFGMLNFGDWWGERGFNWGNIEYDTQHGMMMQFARTGERAWFDNAARAARHNLEVDIVQHGWQGHPTGVPFTHSHCHTGGYYPDGHRPTGSMRGGWNVGHLWTRGNLDYALMTGDERAWWLALQTADYLAGTYMAGFRMNKGAERNTAWPLFGVLAAYHATADEFYLNAARIITREVVREQNPERGHWEIPAGYSQVQPTPIGGYAWCAGLLMTALEMANEHLRDPEIDRTLVRAARWLAEEEWQPDRKGFRSASCDSLNEATRPGSNCRRTPAAMLRAFELTGEETFREIAHVGFSYVVAGGGGGGKAGGTQLILSPHIIYKLKQAAITSLDTLRWEAEARLQVPGFIAVAPGGPVSVPLTVVSQRDHPIAVSLSIEGVPEGWPRVEALTLELPPHGERTASFELPAATALEAGETVALTVTAQVGGGEAMHRQVVLAHPPDGLAGDAIGLVADELDFLGPALEQAGVEYRRIDALDDLSGFAVIFLGTQAHSVNAAGLHRDYPKLLEWVHAGGTLVVSQLQDAGWRPEFLPGTVLLSNTSTESGPIIAPEHPIFAGIAETDALTGVIMYDSIVEAGGWDVLLADAGGGPAIIATDPGAGRILAMMPSVERYCTGEEAALNADLLAACQRLFSNIITWALLGD
ncbi:MAG: hypothetical protein ACOX9R_12205 [Armatimonadota bacterium]|jgi:hypothetical protein